MNLGWVRELFTLSEIEKERMKEPVADPRQLQAFREIEPLITESLLPPVVQSRSSTRILNENAEPKEVPTQTRARSMPDQALLQKLLKHRPQYNSNRILRAEKPMAATPVQSSVIKAPAQTALASDTASAILDGEES